MTTDLMTLQQSIPRRKRVWDFYSDGMGALLFEDGTVRRPKDAKDRCHPARRRAKPRSRVRRRSRWE